MEASGTIYKEKIASNILSVTYNPHILTVDEKVIKIGAALNSGVSKASHIGAML